MKLHIFGGNSKEQRVTSRFWLLDLHEAVTAFLSCKVQCVYNYTKQILGRREFLGVLTWRTESSTALFMLEHCRTAYRVVSKAGGLRTRDEMSPFGTESSAVLVGEQKLS